MTPNRGNNNFPARPTIRDVAALAGVALSSVSRVLSGHPDVSQKMRERVTAAADELGYEPDPFGQSLRSGSSQTIGFLLRDISNPLFANVARYAEQRLRQAGYSMIITSSDGDPEVEATNLNILRRRRVDGLIASLVTETAPSTIKELQAYQVPIVLLDREVADLPTAHVLSDHYSGVHKAVKYLIENKHTDIAMITGALDVRSSRERLRAFTDAFEQAQIPVPEHLCFFGSFQDEFARNVVLDLMTKDPKPTAVLTGGIGPTIGALSALRDLNIPLENGMEVIALDVWPGFDLFAPNIGSVTRDSKEMGTHTAELLLTALKGNDVQDIMLQTEFHYPGVNQITQY